MLIREKLGKRHIESNEPNIEDIVTKNLALRKTLSHSNKNEKLVCDQNNTSSSQSISTNIFFPRMIHELESVVF